MNFVVTSGTMAMHHQEIGALHNKCAALKYTITQVCDLEHSFHLL